MNGADHIKTRKLDLIANIFEIYLLKNPVRKDDWYGDTFDTLYEKSLLDLTVLKEVLLKSKPPYGPNSNRGYATAI